MSFRAQCVPTLDTVLAPPEISIEVVAPGKIGIHQIVQINAWEVNDSIFHVWVDQLTSILASRSWFSNLYPCPGGSLTNSWCCGDTDEAHYHTNTTSCCKQAFASINIGRPVNNPTGSNTTTSNATSSTGNSTSSSTTPVSAVMTPPSASSTNKSAAIGAGVGVPLGVLLLVSLGFLFYRERRHRLQLERDLQTHYNSNYYTKTPIDPDFKAPPPDGSTGNSPQELSSARAPPVPRELDAENEVLR